MKNFIQKILLLVFVGISCSTMAQWQLTGNTPATGEFLGTTNVQPLELMTTNTTTPQPINFYTSNTQRATIDGAGNVGIGTATPGSRVDVVGDVNVSTGNGYRIAGNYVLRANASSSGLFVGINTGTAGSNSTFVGTEAGRNTTANHNTFIGYAAGYTNVTGVANTFVGYTVGFKTTSSHNTFMGYESAFDNTTGQHNTFYGKKSGRGNITGNWNCFFGGHAGWRNNAGHRNSFFGYDAGYNSTGSENVFIGANSGDVNTVGTSNTLVGCSTNVATTGLTNASAIGANAQVNTSNSLILGSVNTVNGATQTAMVGIGLNAPTHRLDVGLGDINVNTAANGYMIDDSYVLWHNADASNIYVGVLAGINDGANSNTMVGAQSGQFNTTGDENTFLGFRAGHVNTTGHQNTLLGARAGSSNSTGSSNTFVGEIAGLNSTADANTFVGTGAGQLTSTGSENTFIGMQVGPTNTIGAYNTIVGAHADVGANNLTNASAIGAEAFVTQSNSIVLGAISGQNGATSDTRVGIGTTAPATRLEVDNIANGSGLRLTQLTTADAPVVNPGTGVLSVDGNGDVIYVTGTGTGTVGACATGTTNRITKWCNGTDIENSIIYENGTRIGVDINPPAFTSNKFHVNNTGEIVGTFSHTSTTGTAGIGIAGVTNNATFANIGVIGQTKWPIGFTSITNLLGTSGVPYSAGVIGHAQGSYFNVGGIFEANSCTANTVNFGLYASAKFVTGAGPTGCGPGIAGYFDGIISITGAQLNSSDQKLKDSISNINNALSVISRLHPKQFVFKVDSFPTMNLPLGHQFGVIAQELDTVLPELVVNVMHPAKYDTSGAMLGDTIPYAAVNYSGLIPIAIAGIQEQQAIIDTLLDGQVTAVPEAVGDTNRVVKWGLTNRSLTSGLMYDDGSRTGIPAVKQGSYFNVENGGADTVAVNATSTNPNTTAVVNAVYTVDSGQSNVAAIRGYSKYQFEPGQIDGVGGAFEGGKWGAYSLGSGANSQGIGLVGESKNALSRNYGVMGVSRTGTDADNIGMQGIADSSEESNTGVIGIAEYENTTSVNVGLAGFAAGSGNENIAGEFEAWDTTGVNYGIFAYANGSAPDAYAGYFDGDVHATGTITWASDATLKEQVQNVSGYNALELINRLQPKTYTFRTADYPYLSLPTGPQYGLLAQEVQQVIPALVKDIIQPERRDRNGNTVSPGLVYKGLNYAGLIPVLIGAVKEQQSKIDSQQTQIDSLKEVISDRLTALENRLNGCCGTGDANKTDGGNTTANHLTVELSSTQVIILEQNVPNPFAEQTSISYFIPDNISSAQMVFTDILGNTIKTADVKSGYGTVTVFAQNLTSGQYSYSLLIDGKVVETKRMVKTK